MQAGTQNTMVSRKMLWTGRIISALLVLFMIFDGGIKVLKEAAAVEGTIKVGYPVSEIVPIGIAALLCTVVYLIPRTSILGAILLTGYLGGATATMVRLQDPWFLFPVLIGVLAWLGLYLRDPDLRRMIPTRRSNIA